MVHKSYVHGTFTNMYTCMRVGYVRVGPRYMTRYFFLPDVHVAKYMYM